MQTKLLDLADERDLRYAINLLREEKIIAFPTETVFGIGCDIFSDNAAASVYEIKNRETRKPLSAHISSMDMAIGIIEPPPDLFYKLADRFLPGPLAIIVKKNIVLVSDDITSGLDTISIRYPADDTCLKLIEEYGKPIAATSANISGEASLLNSAEVYDKFYGMIPAIVKGSCLYDIESTIISLAGESPQILREGAISRDIIMRFIEENK